MFLLDALILYVFSIYFKAEQRTRLKFEELYFKPFPGVVIVSMFFFLCISLFYALIFLGIKTLSSKESILLTNEIQINFILFSAIFFVFKTDEIPQHFLFYISICGSLHILSFLGQLKLEKQAKEKQSLIQRGRLFLYLTVLMGFVLIAMLVADDYIIQNSLVLKSELFFIFIRLFTNTLLHLALMKQL